MDFVRSTDWVDFCPPGLCKKAAPVDFRLSGLRNTATVNLKGGVVWVDFKNRRLKKGAGFFVRAD